MRGPPPACRAPERSLRGGSPRKRDGARGSWTRAAVSSVGFGIRRQHVETIPTLVPLENDEGANAGNARARVSKQRSANRGSRPIGVAQHEVGPAPRAPL